MSASESEGGGADALVGSLRMPFFFTAAAGVVMVPVLAVTWGLVSTLENPVVRIFWTLIAAVSASLTIQRARARIERYPDRIEIHGAVFRRRIPIERCAGLTYLTSLKVMTVDGWEYDPLLLAERYSGTGVGSAHAAETIEALQSLVPVPLLSNEEAERRRAAAWVSRGGWANSDYEQIHIEVRWWQALLYLFVGGLLALFWIVPL